MVNLGVRTPLIYRWSRETKNFLGQRTYKTSMLTFFDTAGEDLREEDVMLVENRYISLSKGLVFLLDPLQIPDVRDRLKGRVPLPEPEDESRDIIVRVSGMIRNVLGIPLRDRIKIPIAVTFSKIDAIRDILDPRSPLRWASPHRDGFDEAASMAVHESVRAHLQLWNAQAIENNLNGAFETYRFFGISSLGAPPSADGVLYNESAPAPLRVEDPMLWLLNRYNLVKVRGKS
jgi:hypothetical protein